MNQGVQSAVDPARATPFHLVQTVPWLMLKNMQMSPGTFQPVASFLGEPPAVDSMAPVLAEQHPKPLARTAHKQPTALITTMTTITTGGSSDCSLAVLSTRLSQQDEQSARDKCQIDELSQQLSDITAQLTHISKVLDCLLASHTAMATLAEFAAAPGSSSASSTAPPGQVPSLPQQSTASGKANPSTSSYQGQTQNNTWNHSARPFLPLEPLPQLPLSLDAPTLGQHSALNQQQYPKPQLLQVCLGPPSTAPQMPPFTAEQDWPSSQPWGLCCTVHRQLLVHPAEQWI